MRMRRAACLHHRPYPAAVPAHTRSIGHTRRWHMYTREAHTRDDGPANQSTALSACTLCVVSGSPGRRRGNVRDRRRRRRRQARKRAAARGAPLRRVAAVLGGTEVRLRDRFMIDPNPNPSEIAHKFAPGKASRLVLSSRAGTAARAAQCVCIRALSVRGPQHQNAFRWEVGIRIHRDRVRFQAGGKCMDLTRPNTRALPCGCWHKSGPYIFLRGSNPTRSRRVSVSRIPPHPGRATTSAGKAPVRASYTRLGSSLSWWPARAANRPTVAFLIPIRREDCTITSTAQRSSHIGSLVFVHVVARSLSRTCR